VLIIGGGIQGAGLAQVYALNGFSVLLLEQFEFGSQTSSRSSKLIHGGLRYLENYQFALVRECLLERQILLRLAPELIRLVPFYIPIYQSTSRSKIKIRAGLSLYALLGGLHKAARFKIVKSQDWGLLDGLEQKNLLAVYQYFDAQTDDRLLTKAVMASACHYGAECVEGAYFKRARINDEVCEVEYTLNNKKYEVSTRLMINASGPWAAQVLDNITPKQAALRVDLVQGSHIELKAKIERGIYYLESALDRRALFVMPRNEQVLIGTTEKSYVGDPAKVQASEEEIQYLLDSVAPYFPTLVASEVQTSYAGLRVLPQSSLKSNFSRSRETQIIADKAKQPKLISVVGGKLTAYRQTAETVFHLTQRTLKSESKYISTAEIQLFSA